MNLGLTLGNHLIALYMVPWQTEIDSRLSSQQATV